MRAIFRVTDLLLSLTVPLRVKLPFASPIADKPETALSSVMTGAEVSMIAKYFVTVLLVTPFISLQETVRWYVPFPVGAVIDHAAYVGLSVTVFETVTEDVMWVAVL